ncbi:MAG: TetR/AcrR family transcriptional regulator [Crocinitomicaceae bacterium]|nr:TetR/AcrR family transcriptional regulator [Crocinitomicaceae bacterium]
MEVHLSNFTIQVNDNIYLKNPDSSDLGKKIISHSIMMIEQDGLENFTFRKLAKRIKSTEASIYRYFESKHKLLLYLISWYWGWMEYKLVFGTANIEDPQIRLEKAIKILTETIEEDRTFSHVNEVKLSQIVISESSKVYLTKDVDEENRKGIFTPYKQIVERVGQIILEINPNYKYPHMLVSTVVEGAHLQRYFADHLPRLTNNIDGEDSVVNFYMDMVIKNIQK